MLGAIGSRGVFRLGSTHGEFPARPVSASNIATACFDSGIRCGVSFFVRSAGINPWVFSKLISSQRADQFALAEHAEDWQTQRQFVRRADRGLVDSAQERTDLGL